MFKGQNAVFSDDRVYRYALQREWDKSKSKVLFIGLNPSSADENEDDNTLTRCINFADSWGYGGIYMANLFSFIDTYQDDIWSAENPIGDETNDWLIKLAKEADKTIVCWGNGSKDFFFYGRVGAVLEIFRQNNISLFCLKQNQTKMPAHPLYLSADLEPIEFII